MKPRLTIEYVRTNSTIVITASIAVPTENLVIRRKVILDKPTIYIKTASSSFPFPVCCAIIIHVVNGKELRINLWTFRTRALISIVVKDCGFKISIVSFAILG